MMRPLPPVLALAPIVQDADAPAGLVARLAEAAGPWQALHADSVVVSSAVLFAHLGALVVGGGLAIAADRATLRLGLPPDAGAPGGADDHARHLRELRALHRPVLVALAVMLASGVLLALTDVEEFAASRVFWIKMALIALLLVNGAGLARAERGIDVTAVADGAWRRLRAASIASLVLWIATLLAGVVLTNL